MLRKFSCVKECSDCCIYREYYPSIEYGKIGVLIMPEERSKIRAIAARHHIDIKIIPRLGIGMNIKGDGPKEIIAYQMMGKNLNGKCTFCNKFSTTIVEKDGTRQEIEALTKIKSEVNVDEKIEIWRYATAIGDKENAAKFFPLGWILQKDS